MMVIVDYNNYYGSTLALKMLSYTLGVQGKFYQPKTY